MIYRYIVEDNFLFVFNTHNVFKYIVEWMAGQETTSFYPLLGVVVVGCVFFLCRIAGQTSSNIIDDDESTITKQK